MSRTSDDGSGTVLALGVVAATLTVFMAVVLVGSAVLAMHRARSAADLAALSAASNLLSGTDASGACGSARRIALQNHATLESCDVTGQEATVGAAVALPAALARLGLDRARATARAGPSPAAESADVLGTPARAAVRPTGPGSSPSSAPP